MIQPVALIALFEKALSEKWGYIYGQAGSLWTEARQKAATREQTVRYGSRWVGRHVADCSGMFAWAFKRLGGYMYHGSNTMWRKYMTDKGTLADGQKSDGNTLKPGAAVFKVSGTNYYHVGLYVGKGTVIEAKGTAFGVVASDITKWHAWGEMRGVDYTNAQVTAELVSSLGTRLLKRARPYMRGDDIKALQTMLNALGYPCGAVDGTFGDKTKAGVKAFQTAARIAVDGVVGPETRKALAKAQNNS